MRERERERGGERQTDRQTDRQRETYTKTNRQTGKNREIALSYILCRQYYKQRNIQTYRLTVRQID